LDILLFEDGIDTLPQKVRDKPTYDEQQPRRAKISATPRKSLKSPKQQRTVSATGFELSAQNTSVIARKQTLSLLYILFI
jgi:hypothetical protein